MMIPVVYKKIIKELKVPMEYKLIVKKPKENVGQECKPKYALIVKKPKYLPIIKKTKEPTAYKPIIRKTKEYKLIAKKPKVYKPIIKKEKTLRQKLAPKISRIELAKKYKVAVYVFDIVQAWEERGFKVPAIGTKGYIKTLKAVHLLLRGKLFNDCLQYESYWRTKFLPEEIIKAFDKFVVMCFDRAFEPVNKEKLKNARYLEDFLLSGYRKKFSRFLWLVENDLKLVLEDKHPEMTKLLMRRYQQEILGTVGGDGISSEWFIKGAQRAVDYFRKYRIRHLTSFPVTEKSIANWLFESLLSSAQKESVTPNYFCSNYTFEVRLPSYLVQQGIVGGEFYKPSKF